jgi:uncharacterized protein (TIGR03083 family)
MMPMATTANKVATLDGIPQRILMTVPPDVGVHIPVPVDGVRQIMSHDPMQNLNRLVKPRPIPECRCVVLRVSPGGPRYSVAVPVDLGQLYRQGRLRITDLVSDQEGDRPVAATPLWTVHDVVAHMAGVMEDARTRNMEGVTTDPWTAAQIARGRSKSVSELLDQWARDAVGPEAILSTPEGAPYSRAVVDVMTHLADLLTAFGRPVDLPLEFLSWTTPQLIEAFNQEVTSRGLQPVEVDAPDFEVFRGRLGRRTEAEVRSFGWSANPEPYLDTWFIFGRAEATLGEICAS